MFIGYIYEKSNKPPQIHADLHIFSFRFIAHVITELFDSARGTYKFNPNFKVTLIIFVLLFLFEDNHTLFEQGYHMTIFATLWIIFLGPFDITDNTEQEKNY